MEDLGLAKWQVLGQFIFAQEVIHIMRTKNIYEEEKDGRINNAILDGYGVLCYGIRTSSATHSDHTCNHRRCSKDDRQSLQVVFKGTKELSRTWALFFSLDIHTILWR